jgi:hypothetical protein
MRSTYAGPIDHLTADWQASRRGNQSRHAYVLLAAVEPEVASVQVFDLHELVGRMREAIGTPGGGWAPGVLQAMLRAQSVHPLVPRAVLQALLPGLVTVARRLSWGSGGNWTDGGAFFADLTTTAWEVISEWKGQDRPYAVLDLLSAIRCRMRRQLLNQRHTRELTLGIEYEQHVTATTSIDATDLELLARAIEESKGKELTAVDAAVLYGVRVLGLSMTDLSKLTGRSRRYLSDRRARAEALLAQSLS